MATGTTDPEETLLGAISDLRGVSVELARVSPSLPGSLRWRAIRLSEVVTDALDKDFPGVGGRG